MEDDLKNEMEDEFKKIFRDEIIYLRHNLGFQGMCPLSPVKNLYPCTVLNFLFRRV